jgi:hypothetical protein
VSKHQIIAFLFCDTIRVNGQELRGLSMKEDKDQMDNQEEQEISEKEIDQDALDVIKRL